VLFNHSQQFNERLRELCAKTRALKAPSLRVLCATIVPATEAEIGLSPAYRGRGLRAFDKKPIFTDHHFQ
jgi:hypothetical protein